MKMTTESMMHALKQCGFETATEIMQEVAGSYCISDYSPEVREQVARAAYAAATGSDWHNPPPLPYDFLLNAMAADAHAGRKVESPRATVRHEEEPDAFVAAINDIARDVYNGPRFKKADDENRAG